MWVVLANILSVAHATIEVAIFIVILRGPLWWATAAVVLVGLPGLLWRGKCWATELERHLRRRGGQSAWKVASMTRRLMYLFTCGLWVRTRRAQWYVMAFFFLYWVARVVTVWIRG